MYRHKTGATRPTDEFMDKQRTPASDSETRKTQVGTSRVTLEDGVSRMGLEPKTTTNTRQSQETPTRSVGYEQKVTTAVYQESAPRKGYDQKSSSTGSYQGYEQKSGSRPSQESPTRQGYEQKGTARSVSDGGARPGLGAPRKTAECFESDVLPCSDDDDDSNIDPEHFCKIEPRFKTLTEVNKEIERVVTTPCGLIFGIDYTLSNIKQGQNTFGGRNLHHISDETVNPYQEVICIFGETLAQIDKTGFIHAFGFGDKVVKDKDIFPLKAQGMCDDFGDVYDTYNEITGEVKLGGPTNFAPLILRAIQIVQETKQFHILIIVADGQVTTEEATIDAIVKGSNYPLSIVVLGVGDGPWEVMSDFEDKLTRRRFDNFQFVEFHKVKAAARSPESEIALAALMKIPDQFKAIKKLKLLQRL